MGRKKSGLTSFDTAADEEVLNLPTAPQLEEIEKDVISILQTAGATLLEIAKDRPAQKTVDNHTQKVMADIKTVEQNLSEQIKYLTQVSTGE